MADQRPTFPAPVKFPFAGSMADAQAVAARVSSLPPNQGVPQVQHVVALESRCGPVGSLASTELARVTPRAGDAARIATASRAHRPRRQGPSTGQPRVATAAEVQGGPDDLEGQADEGGGDLLDGGRPPAVLRPFRVLKAQHKVLVEDYIQEALVSCLRRACGVPVSEPMSNRRSPVTAKIVGDVASRSRAISLRVGSGKNDIAVLWVSSRGGLLCSCFSGTKNALFLSTSSRSTDCRHTHQLQSAITASGLKVGKFRSRMRLSADASNFACCSAYGGSLVWTVLYRSVFSVVSFTAANVATCIASCCRRFRGRCGHVQVAREHQRRVGVTGHTGLPPGVDIEAKQVPSTKARARFVRSEDEDDGLEKLPSDTVREAGDSDQSKLGARHARNMLPCGGEIGRGDAWNRTADWMQFYQNVAHSADAETSEDMAMMRTLLASASRRGIMINVEDTLVDPTCGSCGQRRQERHHVVKEPGLLHTHHPTAPPLKVRCATAITLPPAPSGLVFILCM